MPPRNHSPDSASLAAFFPASPQARESSIIPLLFFDARASSGWQEGWQPVNGEKQYGKAECSDSAHSVLFQVLEQALGAYSMVFPVNLHHYDRSSWLNSIVFPEKHNPSHLALKPLLGPEMAHESASVSLLQTRLVHNAHHRLDAFLCCQWPLEMWSVSCKSLHHLPSCLLVFF